MDVGRDRIPASLLWESTRPFEAQREYALEALEAIGETLTAHRPLGGREDAFLHLHTAVHALDAEALAATWRAPAAHAWSQRTFAALRRCMTAEGDSADADRLVGQLDAFTWFALATAQRAGAELALPTPYCGTGRLNLPGTPLVVQVDGTPIRRSTGLPSGVAGPTIGTRGCAIALVPEALTVPGAAWAAVELAVAEGPVLASAHAPHIEEALGLVEQLQPDTFGQIRDQLQVIALIPEDSRRYPNASSSEHPGAMLLGAASDPFELADHLIHEHHHNRLFALEGMEALLEPDEDGEPAERYYSPWRDELRSLRGILHGAYVFVPVHALWRAAEADHPDAAAHAARIALQLRIALRQLVRFARPTYLGRALLASLSERIAEAERTTPIPTGVQRMVDDHARRFDVAGQVELPEG